ncbi:hypothetical protein ACFSQT_17030 [Mesorhizobium calcicola]|uniref:Uncharacterized protein n=1 Tax=Mesorhizobium calcicola TaxID=1300310 RepID=A0ABW4WFU2_9HYPH
MPFGNPVASEYPKGTISRSGKEAEKPLGKIFAKDAIGGLFFAMLRRNQLGEAHPTSIEAPPPVLRIEILRFSRELS